MEKVILVALHILFVLPFLEESGRGIGYSLLLISSLPLSFYLLRKKIVIDKINLLFFLFLLISVLSTIFSISFWKSLLMLFTYLAYFMFFLAIRTSSEKERCKELIINSLIFNSIFLGILSFFSFAHFNLFPGVTGMNLFYAVFGHNNIDKLLLLTLPPVISLYELAHTKFRKIIFGILTLFVLILLILSFGRTTILISAVFLLIMAFYSRYKLVKLSSIVLSIFIVFILINSVFSIYKNPNDKYLDKQINRPLKNDQRIDYIRQSVLAFISSPVIGTGLDTFRYSSFKNQSQAFSWSWFSMNHYVQMFAETGFLGGIIFLALVILILKESYPKEESSFLDRGLWFAILLSSIHSAFDYDWQFLSIFLYFFLISGLLTPKDIKRKSFPLVNIPIFIIGISLGLFGIVNLVSSVFYNIGIYKDDQEMIKKSADISIWNPDYSNRLSRKYYQENNYKEALKYGLRSVTIEPLNPDYRESLESIYYNNEEYEKALEEILKTKELNPKDFSNKFDLKMSDIYLGIGKKSLENKDLLKAIKNFKFVNKYWKGKSVNMDSAQRHLFLAIIYLENNQYKSSFEQLYLYLNKLDADNK